MRDELDMNTAAAEDELNNEAYALMHDRCMMPVTRWVFTNMEMVQQDGGDVGEWLRGLVARDDFITKTYDSYKEAGGKADVSLGAPARSLRAMAFLYLRMMGDGDA